MGPIRVAKTDPVLDFCSTQILVLPTYVLCRTAGRSLLNFTINSPKYELAQTNQGRVNCAGLSLLRDSWMNPVPACVIFIHCRECQISSSSVLVIALVI